LSRALHMRFHAEHARALDSIEPCFASLDRDAGRRGSHLDVREVHEAIEAHIEETKDERQAGAFNSSGAALVVEEPHVPQTHDTAIATTTAIGIAAPSLCGGAARGDGDGSGLGFGFVLASSVSAASYEARLSGVGAGVTASSGRSVPVCGTATSTRTLGARW